MSNDNNNVYHGNKITHVILMLSPERNVPASHKLIIKINALNY